MGRRKKRRVAIISDLHCGHRVGLTPPQFQVKTNGKPGWRTDLKALQRQCYEFYRKTVESLHPIDVLIVNGDCIDGRGTKSGGVEQLEPDRRVQSNMAMRVIQAAMATTIVMTRGTPYHVGDVEDWEDDIADRVGASIEDHQWVEVNGRTFDIKHFVGSSGIPHGRFTAISRSRLWNVLHAEAGNQPRADFVIRSHVHYHAYCGTPRWLALTTPALQAAGSRIGRKSEGEIDYGLIHFDIEGDGRYEWQPHIARLECQKAQPVKVS